VLTGDFAVLLKAGMSAKQAVFYNILSSVLGFLGMCAGILLGDTKAASGWIFAAAAGMFLYIALVDMVSVLFIFYDEFYFRVLIPYFCGDNAHSSFQSQNRGKKKSRV